MSARKLECTGGRGRGRGWRWGGGGWRGRHLAGDIDATVPADDQRSEGPSIVLGVHVLAAPEGLQVPHAHLAYARESDCQTAVFTSTLQLSFSWITCHPRFCICLSKMMKCTVEGNNIEWDRSKVRIVG